MVYNYVDKVMTMKVQILGKLNWEHHEYILFCEFFDSESGVSVILCSRWLQLLGGNRFLAKWIGFLFINLFNSFILE